jgi:endonuclease YncB( thermonuclease family)
MSFHPRITTPPLARGGWRARLAPLLPWIFIVGVATGVVIAHRDWRGWSRLPANLRGGAFDSELLSQRLGNPRAQHPVTVLRTIDGDTFLARVKLPQGLTVTSRIRLRGIDAPELKAMCVDEFRRARAATDALAALLDQGEVTIFNISPDKYEGRVDADVATARTPNVSAALLAGGYARRYDGGHRDGWCSERSR